MKLAIARQAPALPVAQTWRITWRPPRLSASFHGRDLFAPVTAMLAAGQVAPETVDVAAK